MMILNRYDRILMIWIGMVYTHCCSPVQHGVGGPKLYTFICNGGVFVDCLD